MDSEKTAETTLQTQQAETLPQVSKLPPLPKWPTSRPGPMVKEPPPGEKRMKLRTEQCVEVNYDMERGRPVTNI